MTVSIIAAMDRNRLIGKGSGLPWRLPADLRHFKQRTMGHHLIMGRKTYDTLGGKPLPGRSIVVVTRRDDFESDFARSAPNLADAIEMCGDDPEIFIAGGAEIYRLALDVADRMILTHIDAELEGDTWFPLWDESQWRLVSREDHDPDEKNPWPWAFAVYERRLRD